MYLPTKTRYKVLVSVLQSEGLVEFIQQMRSMVQNLYPNLSEAGQDVN